MNQTVSVLMSIYKEPLDWVAAAVASILNQTYDTLRVILISDNPESGELTRYLQEVQAKDKRVVVLINERNLGLVESLNRGLEFCTGAYIARMDADDISFPTRIEEELAYLKRRKYDLVGCQYRTFVDATDLGGNYAPCSHEACAKVLKYKSCVCHPSWLARRQVFEDLNGYRDIDACEDLDFLQRAVLRGYKIGNTPNVLLRYRDNGNSISHTKQFRQQAIRRCMARALYHDRVVTEDAYLQYISGPGYTLDMEKFEKIDALERDFKQKGGGVKRLTALLRLLMEPIYVEERLWNKRINWAIKMDKRSNLAGEE